jgi:2-oxoglutarate ferredoxin oxidoreductase subunit gamma
MTEMKQLRLAGLGGQGIVLAGLLLGQAGVIDGRNVAGSNSYGAQARGAGCKSEIIFCGGPIDYPQVITADILVSLSQAAYDAYAGEVAMPAGVILYDAGLIKPRPDLPVRQVGVPATECAVNRLKNGQAANIVMLGALVEITGIVSTKAVQKAIALHVGERFRSLNLEALRMGLELGRLSHG